MKLHFIIAIFAMQVYSAKEIIKLSETSTFANFVINFQKNKCLFVCFFNYSYNRLGISDLFVEWLL